MDIDIMVRLEADLDRIFSTAPRCSGDEAVALRGYPMAPQRSPQAASVGRGVPRAGSGRSRTERAHK